MMRLYHEGCMCNPVTARIAVAARRHVQLYNTKDHPIILQKGTAVAQMVAANEVSDMLMANGTVGTLQTHRWAKVGCTGLSVKERRKALFEKLELLGLKLWMEESKDKALYLP